MFRWEQRARTARRFSSKEAVVARDEARARAERAPYRGAIGDYYFRGIDLSPSWPSSLYTGARDQIRPGLSIVSELAGTYRDFRTRRRLTRY